MKTIIQNGIVVTMDQQMHVWDHGYVIIDGTKIVEVGPESGLMVRKAVLSRAGEIWQEKDARRGIIMPGMINTHSHLGMIPFRGLGDDCKDRLRVFLLPMESQAMDGELAAASARYGICELLLSGVTTVLDMYYFEEKVAHVMDQMGIRGIAGETVMEDATCDSSCAEEALEQGVDLIRTYRNHPRVKGALTPHGTTTCSGEHMKMALEEDIKGNTVFTLHTAEMDYEITYLAEKYQMSPVEYLNSLGLLGAHTLTAHSIRLTETDCRLLAETKTNVAHCIGSNTKAAKGVAPVAQLRSLGVNVGLGTDGPASGNTLDLFTQMRMCENFHKNTLKDRSVFPAKEIVKMATIEGAKALGLGDVTGSLELGKEADLVIIETDSSNMFPVYDPYSALVYSAFASNVRDVYISGKCLVEEKRLVKENLADIRMALRENMERTKFKEMKALT